MEVLWRMRRGRRADCRRCERRNCVVRRVGMGETMVEVEVGVGVGLLCMGYGYGVSMEMWLLWDGRCADSGDVEDDESK